ncbi:MAG TPA: hypothetical protein VGK32_03350 [Vicinamibacterales bacterium]
MRSHDEQPVARGVERKRQMGILLGASGRAIVVMPGEERRQRLAISQGHLNTGDHSPPKSLRQNRGWGRAEATLDRERLNLLDDIDRCHDAQPKEPSIPKRQGTRHRTRERNLDVS